MFALSPNLLVEAAVPLAIAAIGFTALARGYRALAGTTLRAPWWWAAGSLAVVAAMETTIIVLHLGQSAGTAQLQLAASTTTLLPLVALLGAKRPQNRAWQLIVFACWAMLALPAGQAWLLRPESPPVMHALWSWFVILLAVIGATNYLPTRYWPAALLAAAGQIVLHWRYRPFASTMQSTDLSLWGIGLLTAALLAAAAIGSRKRPRGDPLDRLWIDFRNQYGVVWGLRVAERINAAAKAHGWDVTLVWQGFSTSYGGSIEIIAPAVRADLEAAFCSLLRRFVSGEWIGRRIGRAAGSGSFLASPAGVSGSAQT